MRTLLLLLFIGLFALPATVAGAQCVPMSDPVAHAQHGPMPSGHHNEAPAKQTLSHDCVGCIAPIDQSVYRPAHAKAWPLPSKADVHVSASLHCTVGAVDPPPPKPLV